jgi:multiple sugar transport system substrate-binding protein
MSGNISRRSLLRTAGLLGLTGAAVSGCGSSLASGLVGSRPAANTLTYWNLLSGGDGDRMVSMEKQYAATHPDIDLKSVSLSWGNPYYTKVALATLGSQPPDVAIAHLTRGTILASAGILEPLDPAELARYGMTAANFTPTAWRKAHTDGKLYAVPLDTHPFVMYYNTDVCRKAGLLDKDGKLRDLSGPTALVEAMQATQKVTGGYGAVTSINTDVATPWRFFSGLYGQLNGSMLADDGRKIVLDQAKAEKVLTYLADIMVKKKLMPGNIDYGGATTLFASGKTGFYFQGDWEISTFQTAHTPFSMTRFPNVFGGTYACQADSHSFVLPKDPSRTPEKRKVIFEFVRSMLDQSATWAAGGHVPAWIPYQHSEAFTKMVPQSQYADAANFARYDDAGWYSGSGSDFEMIVSSAIGSVMAGRATPGQAVPDMVARLTKYAATPSPV